MLVIRAQAGDIPRAMTITGYRAADVMKERGPIKPGLYADMIAVPGDPRTDIDMVRDVQFVMRNGTVFRKDGVILAEESLHAGPMSGWNRR